MWDSNQVGLFSTSPDKSLRRNLPRRNLATRLAVTPLPGAVISGGLYRVEWRE